VKKIAIIVAGGTGHRMNSTIPKQFLLLQGKPILIHTLNQFKKADSRIKLYVVLPKNQMSSAFEYAELHGNAILSVPTKDSIRKWDSVSQKYVAVKRDEIRIIQTPQIFSLKSLRKAFNQSYNLEFTDDASVVESTGETIHLVEGDYANLKITTSEDLNLAESLMKSAY